MPIQVHCSVRDRGESVAWLCTVAAADQPSRVLMVSAYSEDVTTAVRARAAIKKRLEEKSGNTEVFYDALDLARFQGKVHQDRMARFLTDKYAEKRPDVVIALSGDALRYLLHYRETIAPGVPLVFCCMVAPGVAITPTSPGDRRD